MIRAALTALFLAAPVAAQDALATQTAAAAARLSEAAQLLDAAPHSDHQITTLAAAIRAYEDGLIAVRAGLRDTTARYTDLQAKLDANQAEITQLMSVLQAAALSPQPRLGFHPKGAQATARAQIVRTALAPAIAADAAVLKDQLAHLAKAKALTTTATETLNDGLLGLEAAHAALREAFRDQDPPPSRFTEDPEQIAILQSAAVSRDQLLIGLSAIYTGGLPNDAALASKGTLPLPVTGRALPTDADTAGLILATPARALVVTPTSATILYQGPLPGFEKAVVVAPTPGTLFVFGGLTQTFGAAGQIIPAGWPLGLMGETASHSDTILTTNSPSETGGASQALYLEVREGQTPADPATWFALEQ
ncbi:MAG: peptidase M23 [Pseudomonadota bacterium]